MICLECSRSIDDALTDSGVVRCSCGARYSTGFLDNMSVESRPVIPEHFQGLIQAVADSARQTKQRVSEEQHA